MGRNTSALAVTLLLLVSPGLHAFCEIMCVALEPIAPSGCHDPAGHHGAPRSSHSSSDPDNCADQHGQLPTLVKSKASAKAGDARFVAGVALLSVWSSVSVSVSMPVTQQPLPVLPPNLSALPAFSPLRL